VTDRDWKRVAQALRWKAAGRDICDARERLIYRAIADDPERYRRLYDRIRAELTKV
jgi:hypothetical protein